MNVSVWNILDLMECCGEEKVRELLSGYSCTRELAGEAESLNSDIEHFIKSNAIQLAKQKSSISYIVSDESNGLLLGFFTIAHKPIEIPATGLSRTTIKTMNRYAHLDTERNAYYVSAFLIAQLGKNYAIAKSARISGKELLNLVNRELFDLQHRVGGGIAYLDCEPNANLINFYENNGFRLFGERVSEHDKKHYLQYMRFF